MNQKFIGKPPATVDLDRMPERGSHHRRSHSDTSFRFAANFDDLLLFDPSDFDISGLPSPLPLPSPVSAGLVPMSVDSDESGKQPRPAGASAGGHLRSLSVDSDFFDGLGSGVGGDERGAGNGGGERHSNSMEGSSTTSFEADSATMMDGMKKATAPDKLAELALTDPKRAKRLFFFPKEINSDKFKCNLNCFCVFDHNHVINF